MPLRTRSIAKTSLGHALRCSLLHRPVHGAVHAVHTCTVVDYTWNEYC